MIMSIILWLMIGVIWAPFEWIYRLFSNGKSSKIAEYIKEQL